MKTPEQWLAEWVPSSITMTEFIQAIQKDAVESTRLPTWKEEEMEKDPDWEHDT